MQLGIGVVMVNGAVKPRRAVVDTEAKDEDWAKMQLLAHSAKLSDRAIEKRASRKLDLGRWPKGAEVKARGISACAALKDNLQPFLKAAGLDANANTLPDDLYQYVFESDLDYWALANKLRVGRQTREWLAMEGNVCRYFIWPKQEAQFIYATHLPRAINESEKADCVAILGSFIVVAKPGLPTRVTDASCYYLLKSGELLRRGTWTSDSCGVDEERLTMMYRVEKLDNNQPYSGLISIKRDKARNPCVNLSEHYRGTRCFKGRIFTLQDKDFRPGPFVAEEVSAVHLNDDDELKLLTKKEIQDEFVKRLNLVGNTCGYCDTRNDLPTGKCGFVRKKNDQLGSKS